MAKNVDKSAERRVAFRPRPARSASPLPIILGLLTLAGGAWYVLGAPEATQAPEVASVAAKAAQRPEAPSGPKVVTPDNVDEDDAKPAEIEPPLSIKLAWPFPKRPEGWTPERVLREVGAGSPGEIRAVAAKMAEREIAEARIQMAADYGRMGKPEYIDHPDCVALLARMRVQIEKNYVDFLPLAIPDWRAAIAGAARATR